jgi:hypothetical protein
MIALGFSSVDHARFSESFFKVWVRGAAARVGVDRWITTHCIFMASSGHFNVFNCERNTTHEFVSQPESDESDLVPLMMAYR